MLKAQSDYLDILHATIDPTSKDTTPAIRACYRTDLGPAPGCDETTEITQVVVKSTGTLPSFMTLATDRLTIAATSNGQTDTYVMEVTHNMAYSATLIVYDTVTITINVCLLTHVDPPDTISKIVAGVTTTITPIDNTVNIEYSIHALNDIILDLSSPGFV